MEASYPQQSTTTRIYSKVNNYNQESLPPRLTKSPPKRSPTPSILPSINSFSREALLEARNTVGNIDNFDKIGLEKALVNNNESSGVEDNISYSFSNYSGRSYNNRRTNVNTPAINRELDI